MTKHMPKELKVASVSVLEKLGVGAEGVGNIRGVRKELGFVLNTRGHTLDFRQRNDFIRFKTFGFTSVAL